jgi:hypothetical protein
MRYEHDHSVRWGRRALGKRKERVIPVGNSAPRNIIPTCSRDGLPTPARKHGWGYSIRHWIIVELEDVKTQDHTVGKAVILGVCAREPGFVPS